MQASESANILNFPSRTREYGLRSRWVLAVGLGIAVLLAVTVTTLVMHYSQRKVERSAPKAPSTPKMKSNQQESWQLFDNDFYLFWQSEGADCETAKKFCTKRHATLAMVDQNNVQWIQKTSKVKRLWILKDLEGSGSDEQTGGSADVACALYPSGSKSGKGNGWICRKGS
ncbi:uncharacterized protein LOC134451916 [Engraulis encrasicolus]|uniref:uncharacterized protein LOC134451916 n=1 Tax=Engraulis encrasicolus TaxID=184585 RepID=UPI002FD1904F